MKKLNFLTLFIAIFLNIAFSQNNDEEIEALKKKISKSDAELTNPKKTADVKFWLKRGEIFLDAYTVNSKYLNVGLEASAIPLVGISESNTVPFYGKPTKITYEKDFEVWHYPKIKIYVNPQNKTVDHWENLYFIDTNALDKAFQAYIKALDLDKEKKSLSKKNIIEKVTFLRENLVNTGIELYSQNKFSAALENVEKALLLFRDFPKAKGDTVVTIGAYYYYAGIFAYNAKNYSKSIDYLTKAIENKYEVGSSYQYLVQNYYEQNDSANAEKILLEGAEKFPNETKIIYLLIDYYTPKGQYDKAFKYLYKAIEMTPDNPQLYFVLGNAYEKVYYSLEKEYFKQLNAADSLDKLAFREPQNSKKYLEKRDYILANDAVTAEKKAEDYANKTLEAYNKALSFDNSNIDYLYQIAYFYYMRANNYRTFSSNLRKIKDHITKLENLSNDFLKQSLDYAEKAYKLNDKDIYTLRLLKNIYFRLEMQDKYEEVNNKIKQLQ